MKQELIDGIILLIKNLPPWGEKKKITILLGMECFVTYLPAEKIIRIKTIRCDFCGACCMDLPPNSNFVTCGVDDEGKCNALYKDRDNTWKCNAKYNKPYRCLGDPMKINTPECCIEHLEIKV